MAKKPKVVTVVLEIDDEHTVEQIIALYKDSIYVHGCKVLNILEGDVPELLDECENNYSNLLTEYSHIDE